MAGEEIEEVEEAEEAEEAEEVVGEAVGEGRSEPSYVCIFNISISGN